MSLRRAVTAAIAALALLAAVSFGTAGAARAARKQQPAQAASQVSAPPRAAPSGAPASVVVDHPGGARRLAASIQGRVLAEAYLRWGGGGRRIVLLIEPPSEVAKDEKAPAPSGGTSMSISVGSGGGSVSVDGAGGRSSAFTDAEHTRWLAWIDPTGEGHAEILRRDIPGDVRAIDAIDRDGDGNDDLAFWRPGGIWIARSGPGARPDGPLEALIADGDIDPLPNAARALCTVDCPDDRRLWTQVVGSLRAYGAGADGAWARVQEIPMPVEVSVDTWRFVLQTPTVQALPPGPERRRLFAIGPEPFGSDRLRTLLVDPAQPETPPIECWSKLPGPEHLIESRYVWIAGKPALVVTTRSAVKLGIFAEKWLRVFVLAEDRTRRGSAPLLALETKINLWQSTVPQMRDVDRDGRDDLVLPYWKGLSKGHVQIDAYLQTENGSFSRSARTTAFEIREGNRSFLDFGRDLDGDGRLDLVLLQGDEVEVHAGSPRSKKGDDLVEPTARFALPLSAEGAIHVNMPKGSEDEDGDEDDDDEPDTGSSAFSRQGVPRFLDLDGDGRDEIVIRGGGGGKSRVLVFSIPRSTPAS